MHLKIENGFITATAESLEENVALLGIVHGKNDTVSVPTQEKPKRHYIKSKKTSGKVTPEIGEKIKALYRDGMSFERIGRKFNLTGQGVSSYLQREGLHHTRPYGKGIYTVETFPSVLRGSLLKDYKDGRLTNRELAHKYQIVSAEEVASIVGNLSREEVILSIAH